MVLTVHPASQTLQMTYTLRSSHHLTVWFPRSANYTTVIIELMLWRTSRLTSLFSNFTVFRTQDLSRRAAGPPSRLKVNAMERVAGAHELGVCILSESDFLHPTARHCTYRAPTAQGATGYMFWCRSSLTKSCSGDGIIVPTTWLIGPLLGAKWIGYHYQPQACWRVFAMHAVDIRTLCTSDDDK